MEASMKNGWVLLLSATLAACAGSPVAVDRPNTLFQDNLFAPASVPVTAADLFELSPEMHRYLKTEEAAGPLYFQGPQKGLVTALYDKSRLKVDYDAEETRNAAQTFAARTGNCLSLVVMTAAFAKELRIPVRYNRMLVDDSWSRVGDIYFSSAHVNVTLGNPSTWHKVVDFEGADLTVDFLGAADIRGRPFVPIREGTVVAMYMNNRSAEALARGQLDDAYWWARAAIVQDPKFLNSYNTLGAVYFLHGNLPQAEQALTRVLVAEPENPQVMSNLALVLKTEGRVDEASALTRRLDEMQPFPPFYFFNLGLVAMRHGEYQAAKKLFTREIERDPYYHEFHFWLAVADIDLGNLEEGRAQLALAMQNSANRKQHELYAAKLDRIKATHPDPGTSLY
jgi:tetratricopeptide (TPR) repeat protein